jgi:hypothetical protein
MSFKLKGVKKKERSQVLGLGGRLLPDGKTWVIPDEIKGINGFASWLPHGEGFIVQRPYFVLRAKCSCWKCGKEMPVVALGATCFQYSTFEDADLPVWNREEGPIMFTDIRHLDATIVQSLKENYGFFRQLYLEEWKSEEWGNCCVHCGIMQEADGDWRYGLKSAFTPSSIEEARDIRIIYFKLPFDYYIGSGFCYHTLLDEMIR